MISLRSAPHKSLNKIIECYWYIEHNEPPHIQKIIPDGFLELIFHFKDLHLINLHGSWDEQSRTLFAGQIKKYFYLKNKGAARMFGIKLRPTAMRHLFGLSMHPFTNQVADLSGLKNMHLSELEKLVMAQHDFENMVTKTEDFLKSFVTIPFAQHPVDMAVDQIINSRGKTDVQMLCNLLSISERHLERIFREYVGLPPKFYARIIRFSNIFHLVNSKDPGWSDLVYDSGFYDQSHFIRNFKAFTGEEPTSYLFHEPTFANFFLQK